MRLTARGERLSVSAPKGVLTAALRDEIAARKREILDWLRRRAGRAVADGLGRAPGHEPSPLSFAQERIWFLEQLEPGGAMFNLCRAVRLNGALDISALRASFDEMLRRQESLRTIFAAIDGRPRQTVAPFKGLTLDPVDLRSLAEAEREKTLFQMIAEESRRPFDLTAGRLLRVGLARLQKNDHALWVTTHHIAADAWSMGILWRDLWSFYQDYASGQKPRSPEPPCQYRQYALWQREQLCDQAFRSQLDHWKKSLADAPRLDLATNRPRPLKPSFRCARAALEIGPGLTAALKNLARGERATLFMALLAAFHLLLAKYSGQEDIVVGAPVANRNRAGLENLIGLFINALALRLDLSGAPSFRDLLRRARAACLDAYAAQDVPFEKIVQELEPERELNRHPLFQTVLVFQNTPAERLLPPGLSIRPIEVESHSSQLDLSLYLRERGGRLLGYLEYATELFHRATAERMTTHFQNLLERAVKNPEREIAAIETMSAAERRRVLVRWNATRADYPRDACIHHLFEARVQRAPDAVALEYRREKWSYLKLNRRANSLARRLVELGVGPEKLVGVMMEPAPAWVASLLAVFKAGGAYVPLDPTYPLERLSFMIRDAGLEVLVTRRKFAGELVDRVEKVLCVDECLCAGENADADVDGGAAADNAAYVIYTSGSTGLPKGVVGLHRGAINRMSWMWQAYPFAPGENNSAKTSPAFVDSVWEMFGALLQGVPTVIFPREVAADAELLARQLRRRRVTRLVAVPSLLRAMVDQCAPLLRQLGDLKVCVSSGEALPADLAARFRALLPGCRLLNLYGSSEVAGDVTCYEVGAIDAEVTVPLGRPIANTQIYLLDRHLRPVPPGARGEIYVGGDNLARGYFRRPELTREKFLSNPFDPAKASRLYRTGDLGRYLDDGNLEFLGRVDDQVKIRGHRIEPGEIEAALDAHPAVAQSVVVACKTGDLPDDSRDHPPSGLRLVAYWVAAAGAAPVSASDLRNFLREQLPEFMVPELFVALKRLPLLPNGKVDRRSLARGPISAVGHGEASDEPRTELENIVARVWSEALGVERIGVKENFFELGGHSLLAARTAARLREGCNAPIAVGDLFAAPTVRDLTRLIEKRLRARPAEACPPIGPTRRKGPAPVSAGQARLFLFSQLLGGDFLNLPYAYRLHGPLDFAALKRSLDEIVSRHETLRSYFVAYANGPVQKVRRRARAPLGLIDLLRHPAERREEKVEEISRRDAARSFDLEKPPLFRATLVRLAAEEHVLLVTMHHLISDQWSMGVFGRELAELYRAFSAGLPSPREDLPIQFSDFVSWQREMLSRGLFDGQIAYWRKQLADRSPRLVFRLAKKRSGARFSSARYPIEIDADLTARIKALAARQSATPFLVALAALNVLLYRQTGETDIRIATLTANRRPGTEGLIGYFVNALVLRTKLHPGMSFLQLLKSVRRVSLQAYAHQDLPFEHLENLLGGGRRRAPLYRVMLNYRSFSPPWTEANGLRIASWSGKSRAEDPGIAIARVDVDFRLRELPTTLTGAVNYKTDLFDRGAMAELVADYISILNGAVQRPERKIDAVDFK